MHRVTRRALLGVTALSLIGAPAYVIAGHAETRGATTTVADAPNNTPITPEAIIERAWSWMREGPIPYSQTSYYTNRYGTYRQDCSGYATMAWNISSGPTTRTLYDSYTHAISKSQLRAGDSLLDPSGPDSGHIVLFHKWANEAHTEYWGFEQSGDGGTHHRKIPYPYFNEQGAYSPRRYHKSLAPAKTGEYQPTTQAAKLAVGSLKDGRLEVFAATASGIRTAVQRKDGTFSDWRGLGGPDNAKVMVVNGGDGRMDVFAMNRNQIRRKAKKRDGTWSDWLPFDDRGGTSMTGVLRGRGNIQVFVSSGTGIRTKRELAGGGWSDWHGFGPMANAKLDAIRDREGDVHVFAMNDNRIIRRVEKGDSWGDWHSFDNAGGTSISSVNTETGRIRLFVSGPNGTRMKAQTDDGWDDWRPFGDIHGRLATTIGGQDFIHIFANDPSGTKARAGKPGDWGDWHHFGPNGEQLTATVGSSGRVNVFRGTANGVQRRHKKADGTWSEWSSLGGPAF